MKQCMEGGAWLSNSHSAVRVQHLCWITLILMTNMYGRPDCIFKMQCGGTQKRIKIGICTQPDTYYDVSKKLWVLGESLILLGFILITDCMEHIFSLGVQTETRK